MSEVKKYKNGSFCWYELSTTDANAAKKFYGEIFGWDITDTPMDNGGIYTLLQIDGKDVAALYELMDEQKSQGVPPHWLSYITVDNVDESLKVASAEGGKVIMQTLDVLDHGRMALIQDPSGAELALWQPQKNIGAKLHNQTGTRCWNELVTNNAKAVEGFYTKLFGWRTQKTDMGNEAIYTVFMNGDEMAAGMMKMTEEWRDATSHWMVYYAVDDCDKTVEKAKSLGSNIIVPPTDVPNVGRFATIQDPQGAVFSVIK